MTTTTDSTVAPLSDSEFQGLLTLNSDYKQFYCLNHCHEQKCIYLLKTADGSPLMLQDSPQEGDDESSYHVFIPIWSHPDLVKYYLEHGMSAEIANESYELSSLSLELFNDKWVPTLEDNHIALALMPLNHEDDFNFVRAGIFTSEDPAATAQAEAQAQDKAADAAAAATNEAKGTKAK